MPMRWLAPVCALVVGSCGGATLDEGRDPAARPTFVMDGASCTGGRTPTADAATVKQDPSDALAVVELVFVDECTGTGGNWIVAREIDSYRKFFLGAHACRVWTTPPPGRYGVVRYGQTAGILSPQDGACIALPGEATVRTDLSTSGVVVFETREAAEAFARARGWTKRS